MTDATTTETESKRARVRRLLIEPLTEGGMRAPKGTPPEKAAAYLDRLCDELAYLSDDGLGAVRRWAEANGEGSARCFWPGFVRFAQVAQAFQPRPVEELPEVASWFASRAGVEALAEPGRLVAELRFIEAKRRPPVIDHERARVRQVAAELAAEVARARELRDCGRMFDDAMLARFEADEARARAIVAEGAARRGEQVAA